MINSNLSKDYAFCKCTSIKSITLPASVTNFGNSAFFECDTLTNVYITDLAAWATMKTHPMMGNGDMKLFLTKVLIQDLVVPQGVTSIGYSAFACCNSIRSVTLPDSLKEIGSGAFVGCTGLQSIDIPDSVTMIEENVFTRCTNLRSVKLPNGLTHIWHPRLHRRCADDPLLAGDL